MEWTELQAIWQQYDARLAESTRINKEILRRMLRSKPEKRLKRMKGWAVYGIVAPVPIMCIALIPNIKFRNEWDFYSGFVLLAAMLVYILYHGIQWYIQLRDIDFANQIAKTRKQLIQLKEYRLKTSKLGWVVFLILLIGIYLLMGVEMVRYFTNTKLFYILNIFIFLHATVTFLIRRRKLNHQLNNFNAELNEIEQLEKDN